MQPQTYFFLAPFFPILPCPSEMRQLPPTAASWSPQAVGWRPWSQAGGGPLTSLRPGFCSPPTSPLTWLRRTTSRAMGVSVFFSWWGKEVEAEERKDGARMTGMEPHLLLSSSPDTLAPQGNTPVSGQQPAGTGCPALSTLCSGLRSSPGQPGGLLEP